MGMVPPVSFALRRPLPPRGSHKWAGRHPFPSTLRWTREAKEEKKKKKRHSPTPASNCWNDGNR